MSIIGYGHLAKFVGSNIYAYQDSLPKVDVHYHAPSKTVLITAKNKYLRNSGNITQGMLSSIMPTNSEIKEIQKASGTISPVELYSFQDNKLKIITFNIATHVQRNIIYGSEKIRVRQCQDKYPKYGGWSQKPKVGQIILSQCTLNATEWLASQRADLIGLQESTMTYLPKIVRVMNEQTDIHYEAIGSGPVQFIYNIKTLGRGYLLSPPNLYIVQPSRQMIVVWFPQIQLLAINLHAPHNVDLEKEIINTFNRVPIGVNPSRIIMVGDFNDAYHQPLVQLALMGRILRQHGIAPYSCCTDMNYTLVGDYIFDTEYQWPGFYGISPDAFSNLMSDHYPVVFYE